MAISNNINIQKNVVLNSSPSEILIAGSYRTLNLKNFISLLVNKFKSDSDTAYPVKPVDMYFRCGKTKEGTQYSEGVGSGENVYVRLNIYKHLDQYGKVKDLVCRTNLVEIDNDVDYDLSTSTIDYSNMNQYKFTFDDKYNFIFNPDERFDISSENTSYYSNVDIYLKQNSEISFDSNGVSTTQFTNIQLLGDYDIKFTLDGSDSVYDSSKISLTYDKYLKLDESIKDDYVNKSPILEFYYIPTFDISASDRIVSGLLYDSFQFGNTDTTFLPYRDWQIGESRLSSNYYGVYISENKYNRDPTYIPLYNKTFNTNLYTPFINFVIPIIGNFPINNSPRKENDINIKCSVNKSISSGSIYTNSSMNKTHITAIGNVFLDISSFLISCKYNSLIDPDYNFGENNNSNNFSNVLLENIGNSYYSDLVTDTNKYCHIDIPGLNSPETLTFYNLTLNCNYNVYLRLVADNPNNDYSENPYLSYLNNDVIYRFSINIPRPTSTTPDEITPTSAQVSINSDSNGNSKFVCSWTPNANIGFDYVYHYRDPDEQNPDPFEHCDNRLKYYIREIYRINGESCISILYVPAGEDSFENRVLDTDVTSFNFKQSESDNTKLDFYFGSSSEVGGTYNYTLQENDTFVFYVAGLKEYIDRFGYLNYIPIKTVIRNNPITSNVYCKSSSSEPLEFQAKVDLNVNGQWKSGKVFINVDGQWKKASKVFTKVNDTWKEQNNS